MAARKKETQAPVLKNPYLPIPAPVLAHHRALLDPLFKQWRELDRIPPVLLMTGRPGVGKRSVAYYLAQWIFCERVGWSKSESSEAVGDLFGGATASHSDADGPGDPVSPCDECASCRRALHGTWVDFTEVKSEDAPEEGKGQDTGSLKVDQFRRLKASLGFGAHDSAYRVILIPDAERLTISAANSLLKVLEEPPRGWVFLLTANDPSLLLPTIVSRCQTLRLAPLPVPALVQVLDEAQVPGERQKICAELSEGSWSKAMALAGDDVWDRRAALFRFLERPELELSALVDWAAAEKPHLLLLADQLEQVLGDLVRFTVHSEVQGSPAGFEWQNADGRKALETHAQSQVRARGGLRQAREFWTGRAERVNRVRTEAQAPLNRKILAQDVLMPWL